MNQRDYATQKPLHFAQGDAGIAFIVPQLPPAVCGLGDYSSLLLDHLKLETKPRIFVDRGAAASRMLMPGYSVEQLERSTSKLVNTLEASSSKHVILEYVGYGYHSRCCPLWLLRGLTEWRRRDPERRLLLMLMELWFVPAWWKPDFLLQKIHKFALRRLAKAADTVFVSSQGYYDMLETTVAPNRLRIVPVGSNVLPATTHRAVKRQKGCWILFGRQGSRIVALKQLLPWLAKLHASGRLRVLQVAGARENTALDKAEDALLAGALPGNAIRIVGRLPEPELSKLLLEAEFALCGQHAGAHTKSTIFMAYASHGVNIVSTEMRGIADEPLCWVTHPDELMQPPPELDTVLSERSAGLRQWFQRNASWERIAASYRKELGLPLAVPDFFPQ